MLHLFRRKCESWFYSPDILIFWDQGKSCKRFHLGFVRDTLAALFNTSWLTITRYTTQYNIGSEPVHCPGCRSFWFARTCELGHRRSWEKLQKRICFRKFIAAPINWYYVPRTFKNTVVAGFIDAPAQFFLLFLTSIFGCFLNPEFSWYKETHQRECVVSLRGNINVQEECKL